MNREKKNSHPAIADGHYMIPSDSLRCYIDAFAWPTKGATNVYTTHAAENIHKFREIIRESLRECVLYLFIWVQLNVQNSRFEWIEWNDDDDDATRATVHCMISLNQSTHRPTEIE